MTYYIGSARHDERGKYTGGKAGDQTGNEVATQKMYDYISKGGWVCYRFINPFFAVGMKDAMLTACSNSHIGYSQSDRYGVIRNGIDTKKDTNADCSTLIRACIIAASNRDVGDFTTASEGAALKNSGMFYYIGKVNQHSRLYEGDILVTARKGHTAAVTTGLDPMDTVTESPKAKVVMTRSTGRKYASDFCSAVKAEDNIQTVGIKVLQHALNLDYDAGLTVDGEYGPKTDKALGSHYVKLGEKQYLVSAAEILCYLIGSDPCGFEVPGKYGRGLKKATGRSKLDSAWFRKKVQ